MAQHEEIEARVDRDLRSMWLTLLAMPIALAGLFAAILIIPSSSTLSDLATLGFAVLISGPPIILMWVIARRRPQRALAESGPGFDGYEREMTKRNVPLLGWLALAPGLLSVARLIAHGEWRSLAFGSAVVGGAWLIGRLRRDP
jgi:hypothetical protein